MSRDLRVQLIAAVILVAALMFSGLMATRVAASTGQHKLTSMDSAEEGDPPQVAVGIAMGAFRGLFVNMLWMRANDLKEEGKYYEAMELARAITRLQPRFNQVWVFHAWNMSYNISVTTQTEEERWQWVNAGIRLLRNEGVVYNPNDMLIHKELAWIFLHKIGGYTDDANGYYKRMLAMEWTEVLGPPPAPTPETLRDRDAAIEAYVAWLREIADAPDTIQDAIRVEPSIQTLLDRMNAIGARPERRRTLAFHASHIAIKSSGNQTLFQSGMSERELAVYQMADDPELANAWRVLLAHFRKRTLIDDYNMEPERMIRYTQKYGPIDWRHPAAHSLYWAARGVEQGIDRATDQNLKDWDFTNTDRIVIQSIQELYRSGELYFGFLDFKRGDYALWDAIPNLHYFESYGSILRELASRNPFEGYDLGARAYGFYQAGYENFLKDAVTFFYRRGQIDEAERWRSVLRADPRMNMLHDPDRDRLLNGPLNEFVDAELNDRATSPSIFVAQVTAALDSSFVSGLLGGNEDLFLSQFEYAKRFHRYYMQEQRRITLANPGTARMDQWPPDFEFAAGSRFSLLMQTLSLDEAEQMYERAPESLKQYAFDALKNHWKEGLDMAKANGGRGFDEIFPEPPGMDAFHKDYERKLNEWQNAAKVNIEQK